MLGVALAGHPVGVTEVEIRSADVVDALQELRYAFVPQGQQPVA